MSFGDRRTLPKGLHGCKLDRHLHRVNCETTLFANYGPLWKTIDRVAEKRLHKSCRASNIYIIDYFVKFSSRQVSSHIAMQSPIFLIHSQKMSIRAPLANWFGDEIHLSRQCPRGKFILPTKRTCFKCQHALIARRRDVFGYIQSLLRCIAECIRFSRSVQYEPLQIGWCWHSRAYGRDTRV